MRLSFLHMHEFLILAAWIRRRFLYGSGIITNTNNNVLFTLTLQFLYICDLCPFKRKYMIRSTAALDRSIEFSIQPVCCSNLYNNFTQVLNQSGVGLPLCKDTLISSVDHEEKYKSLHCLLNVNPATFYKSVASRSKLTSRNMNCSQSMWFWPLASRLTSSWVHHLCLMTYSLSSDYIYTEKSCSTEFGG